MKSSISTNNGEIEGRLALARSDGESTFYSLRIVNRSSSPLRARLAQSQRRTHAGVDGFNVEVAPFSISETLFPRIRNRKESGQTTVKISGIDIAFTLSAPGPQPKHQKRWPAIVASGLSLCVGIGMFGAFLVPSLPVLAAPVHLSRQHTLEIPYSFGGLASMRYALRGSNGAQISTGMVVKHFGVLHFSHLPNTTKSIRLDTTVSGLFGSVYQTRTISLVSSLAPVKTGTSTKTGATAKTSGNDVRAFITMRVDAVDEGETLAIIRGPDVLIPVASLIQAGLHGLQGKHETISKEEYVSLASLAPGIQFNLNPDSLTLDITVQPKYLPSVQLDIIQTRPPNVEYLGSRSAYLNYVFSGASSGEKNVFLETGISSGTHVLYNSVNFATGQSIRRGLTYFENDDRLRLVRQTYGDFTEFTGDLGSSVFMGGVKISRAFDLDPYAIHYPIPGFKGAVTSPSTADIYINGVLTSHIDLAPGNFNLSRLPVVNGSTTTKIVVTDSFGRTQTYGEFSYTSANLLTRGTTDFEYTAGLLRNNAFQNNDTYGPAALTGQYRLGINDNFTFGARSEISKGLISFGPSADIALRAGMLHIALAASDTENMRGSAMSAAYSFSGQRFGVGTAIVMQSKNYATLSQSPTVDRTTSMFSAFAATQIGRYSLGAQISRNTDRDTGPSSQYSISASTQIARTFNLAVTAERNVASGNPHSSILIMLTKSLGTGGATLTQTFDPGNSQTVLQVQESPPRLLGASYVASISSTRILNGSMVDRTKYGDFNFDISKGPGIKPSGDIRFAGGLAFIGKNFYLARPITGSFALVDIPQASGVHVYLENQDVGQTDRNGHLLLTGLLPDYGNAIRIEDADVSLNSSLQTEQRWIAPPPKGGAVVTFAAVKLQALIGTLLVIFKGKTIIPADGEIDISTNNGYTNQSDIGNDGAFYLENIPPGTYKAVIQFAKGTCAFQLVAPVTTNMLTKLGTLTCRQ